ncbi:transposase [Paraburkholderia sp. RL17-337-BIB-A]|uniref:IS66 family transposase n=1 Tax=Paraburkholderia sp. RL17-337-BIB-A TaxID=3031636 RepID=UPI0038BA4CE5
MPINVTITAEELKQLLDERNAARELRDEREALRGELRLVTAQRDLAEERLRAYRRELFGAKSEARASEQPGLFNEAEALGTNTTPAQEDTPETKVAEHTRKKRGHRKLLDPNLPREVRRHELSEAERFCAPDGHALVEIGVETSEQLDVIPEQVRVVQHQRVKYACPCCDLGIKVTPAPPRIIPRGLFTESALAWIAAGKYRFGMPIYRQSGLLRRFGGDISSNTVAASMVRVGVAAQPVINLMRDALLDAEVIYCDETTFQVLKEKGRRPQTKSYLWAQMTGSGIPIRCFTYTPGRGGELADKLFAAEARSETWTVGRRQRLRRRYSTHVLDAIKKLMLEQLPAVLPNSLLGKALNYLRGQWPKLVRYVENGSWPISNNPCHAASGMTGIMPPVELCRAHWIASLQMPAALGSNA